MHDLPPVRPVALVTGASGFIGGHLVRRLVQQGWTVHVISRPNAQMPNAPEFAQVVRHAYDGSIASAIICMEQARPDVVFHLASLFLAQHDSKDVDALIQSNLLFGTQLLDAMRVNQIRCMVNTGTSWQHFNNQDYNPVCLYAATKQAFEALLTYYVEACDFKVITLKLFDTYGPDDYRAKLIKLLHEAAFSGEPLNMSAGEQRIDLVHVDDVVDAYMIAARQLMQNDALPYACYGLSNENLVSLRELVTIMQKALGRKITVNWGARPYRPREVMQPWRAFQRLPGWTAQREIADFFAKNYAS